MAKRPDPPSSDSLETLRSAAGIGSKRPDRAGYGVSKTAMARTRRRDSARRVGFSTLLGVVLLLGAAAAGWWWWAPREPGPGVEALPPVGTTTAGSAEETTTAEAGTAEGEVSAEDVVAPDPPTGAELARIREEVAAAILAWSEAWSRREVDRYLARYAAEFSPDGGQSRETWEGARRSALEGAAWLRVAVVGLQVAAESEDRAVATFTQTLRGEGQQEVVRKRLDLLREGTDWRILGERVLERLPAEG